MRIMGLVEGDPDSGEETASLECPISDSEAQVLVSAGTHEYFPNIRAEGINDGYLSGEFMRLSHCI